MKSVASGGALTRLATGLETVLDAFARAHDAVVRVWTMDADARELLYPPGGEPADEGEGEGEPHRHAIRGGRIPLELEVRGAGAADAGFLATTLDQLLRAEFEAHTSAREIADRYEEINLLYTISEILGSILSLEQAASRMLREVADVLGARRASLWVYHPDDDRLHLTAAVGEAGRTGPIPTDEPSSVTAWVFRERKTLNLERGSDLPPGIRMDLRPRRHEAFLSVPINYTSPEGTGRTVGVVTLVGRRSDESFDAGDARLLTAIASQVGAAIEIHRLFRESLAQERIVHEMGLAHDLQLKLLPETARFEGIADVAARCLPAESVGGDFYHLFRLGDDRLGVMIGDVSSHGFSAALIMAMTMSAASIYAPESASPGEVLRRVHQALIDELETTEMYMSLFYGVLHLAEGRLVYSNAGHPHAFRIGAEGPAERLGATNPPLGTVPLQAYEEASADWTRGGDLLCLFTDGLSDFCADGGLSAGEERLLTELDRLRDRPPAEILDRLFALAGRAVPGVPPDDRTAVLVRA